MSSDYSESSDSDVEKPVMTKMKKLILMDSDEEFDSADERPTIEDNFTEHDNNESNFNQSEDQISETDEEGSDHLIDTNDSIDISKSNKHSLTPQLQKNLGQNSQGNNSVIISSDSEDGIKQSTNKKGHSFMTPQNKRPEIDNSDTDSSDTDNSDTENYVIDNSGTDDSTSILIDDSFGKEAAEAVEKRKTSGISNVSINNSEVSFVEKIDSQQNEATKKIQSKDDLKQITLDDMFKQSVQNKVDSSQGKIECKRTEFNDQMRKIRLAENAMMQAQKTFNTVQVSSLPDKGENLKNHFLKKKAEFLEEQNLLKKMVVVEEDVPEETENKKPHHNWNDLEAGIAIVQPKTFGKKGLENYQNQKALTVESLEQLHGSLKNRPTDDQLADDPKGLKVTLMEHQKSALAWLMYRERQKPSGGILADDMGLGKTLTMISLILNTKENDNSHDEEQNDEEESISKKHIKYHGGTLVVCPASLLNQWAQEIDNKLKRGTLSCLVYHGPKREEKPKRLAAYDVVITTYSLVMSEFNREGTVFRVRWKRIILDEAHQIRNHKAQTSIACCSLAGKFRWALTGTPVHNKELDMYALLKFLRCSPFDDLLVWKRWVGDKGSGGGERLNTVISSLMLRRTKADLLAKGKLNNMPSRKWDLIPVVLDESELSLYQKILLFSQTLFAQFLHQKAERNQDIINLKNPNADPNSEYFKMRKKLMTLNRMREVNQHEILVLLLRLRQICCHTSLIINMLQGDEDLGDDVEYRDEINLLEQLSNLNLDDTHSATSEPGEVVGFKEAAKSILNPSHTLFAKDRMSSKVKAAMNLIPNILSSGDKIIVVSQWTSFLDIFGIQLDRVGIKFSKLDGKVPTAKRTEMVTFFNDPNTRVKVLLLSLTAGGVGLNLVGANHLFLLDLHWNPQLENQAQDRIYRMGQKKNVNIYKFMAKETIEEKIKNLQEEKIKISESMLTGSKMAFGSKLSLHDLKMLFNM